MFMSRIMVLIVIVGSFVTTGWNNAKAEVMGIDQPGTTDWPAHWFGCVSNVVPLDYDAIPSSISIDALRQVAYVTFSPHLAPYIRKISLSDLSFSDAIRWNFSFGTIITSTQMPDLDRTLFLSKTDTCSYLIQMSNLNNDIVRVSRFDCQAAGPIVYAESCQAVFTRDGLDGHRILKFPVGADEMLGLTIDCISTGVTTLIFDDSTGLLYALSSDYPGDVVRIRSDTFETLDSITLPGELRCEQGLLDSANNQLIIKAQGQEYSSRFLIKIVLDGFFTGSTHPIENPDLALNLVGITNACLYVIIPGTTSVIKGIDPVEFFQIDELDLPVEGGPIEKACINGFQVFCMSNDSPSKMVLLDSDPLFLRNTEELSSPDNNFISVCYNSEKSEILLSSLSADPAKITVLNSRDFSKTATKSYSINQDGSISILCMVESESLIYAFHTGNPPYLLKINNQDYEIENLIGLSDPDPAVDMMIDESSEKVFLLRDDSLSRYDADTLSFEEEEQFAYPNDGLVCLLHDAVRDQLVVCNASGKAFKVAKQPITIIGETSLPAGSGSITQGVVAADLDLCVMAVKTGESEPAKLAELDLNNFTFMDIVTMGDLETEFKAMVYDPVYQIMTCGVDLIFGGMTSYALDPLERMNQSVPYAMGRYICDGVFDPSSGNSYWCNTHFIGLIAKTTSNSSGFICGNKTNLTDWVHLNHLAMYSHQAVVSVRLGLYNASMQLVWQSDVVNDQSGWIIVPIEEGNPDQLSLGPGDYWLTFQTNCHERAASAHPPCPGSGIRQPASFSSFPSNLWYPEITGDQWAIYADWDPLYPTSTPTATPTVPATPSFTPSPTGTPEPSATDSPTATTSPVPESGVQLDLSGDIFIPGDFFLLTASVEPGQHTNGPIDLWVILDVYGSYWFGPGWLQDPDWYNLGILTGSHLETILSFTWPQVTGSADGLFIWGAILDPSTFELLGVYDRVEFGYRTTRNS